MPTSILGAAIEATLRRQPGLTARELLRELRRSGQVGAGTRKRNLNQVLYGEGAFVSDGGYVPRWRLSTESEPRADRRATTVRVRVQRARLQETADRMVHRSTTSAGRTAAGDPARRINWGTDSIIPGLRDWQRRAITSWVDAGASGVIEAVTGTGKTHLGLELASRMAREGGQTTVLVPTVELQRQWCENFAKFADHLTLAAVGGRHSGERRQADVTVALVQSAINTDLTPLDRPGLLVADETHRYGARTWSSALRPGYRYRLGLTATLERDGDRGVADYLVPYFERTVYEYHYAQAVPERVVAPFTLAMLGVNLSAEEQGEYDRLSRTMARSRAVLEPLGVFVGASADIQQRLAIWARTGGVAGDAARDYEKSSRNRRLVLARCGAKVEAIGRLAALVGEAGGTVVFAQTIDSAEDAARSLRRVGVQAAAIHSGMHSDERRENLDRLRDQSIAALCAPKILDEGIDVPNLDLGIVMSASSGRRQMIQRLGRVIRVKEDGRHARFVVLYAEGTVEDPTEGAHETFLEMVRDVATKQTVLPTPWAVADVEHALALPIGWRPDPVPALPMTPPPLPPSPTPRHRSLSSTVPVAASRHAATFDRASVDAPRGWQRACDEGGMIRAKGRACWAAGFRGLVSPEPVAPTTSGDWMAERVRSVVLDVALDQFLDRSRRVRAWVLADGILEAAAGHLTESGAGDRAMRLYRKLPVPVPSAQGRGGYTLLAADLVLWRPRGRDVVLQVDVQERRESPRILEAAARSGAIALWIPLHAVLDLQVPPGVEVIDLHPLLP